MRVMCSTCEQGNTKSWPTLPSTVLYIKRLHIFNIYTNSAKFTFAIWCEVVRLKKFFSCSMNVIFLPWKWRKLYEHKNRWVLYIHTYLGILYIYLLWYCDVFRYNGIDWIQLVFACNSDFLWCIFVIL